MQRILLLTIATLFLAVSAYAGTISGELVVLDGSANRFRVIGHDGSYTAPAGTSLSDLSGKNVEVELSGSRVTQITERSVAITPVTSGVDRVRGQLIVRDPVARSFALAGDTRVYIAPATIDIAPYGGQWVELSLTDQSQVAGLKLISAPPAPVSVPVVPAAVSAGGAATCLVGNSTVASGSTVCREGVTHRCDSGAWVSLGTACR
ncbi:MAG: hypothetical protein ABI629_17800 [bacterium]